MAGSGRDRGFTLVELMVVLVIVGLMGTAVALLAPDGRPSVADEAERFAARLKRAQEEAVLTNRAVDVVVTADGYSFRTLRRGDWAPLDEGPFGPEPWSEGLAVEVQGTDGRSGVRFDPTGSAAPAVVSFSREPRRAEVRVDQAGGVRIDAQAG